METFTGAPFEALGEWKFDVHGEQVFVGVLRFDPVSGLELRVVDPGGRGSCSFGAGAGAPPTRISACGRTHSHGHISLFDGFVRSAPASTHGPPESLYFFNRGLLGIAETNAGERKFSSIFATGDLLRVWLDQKIVDCDLVPTAESISVRHTIPKPVKIGLDVERTLVFAWDRLGPNLHLAQSSIEITSRPWVGIEFSKPRGINAALKEAGMATRLISLISGYEMVSSLTDLRPADPEVSDGPVYFLASRKRSEGAYREWTPRDLLFTFPSVATRFDGLAKAWFSIHEAVPGCMNVYFSAHYSAYTNQRLFALTTALESFHRHIAPPGQWTLRNRVKDSIDRISSLAGDVVRDKDAFAARVVAYRNNEAHCNEDDNAGSGSQHFRLASKIRVMMDALIMKELGLSITEISAAMRGSNEYWFYAADATWPWDV